MLSTIEPDIRQTEEDRGREALVLSSICVYVSVCPSVHPSVRPSVCLVSPSLCLCLSSSLIAFFLFFYNHIHICLCVYIYMSPGGLPHYPPVPQNRVTPPHYPPAFGTANIGIWKVLELFQLCSAVSEILWVLAMVFLNMQVGCLKNGPLFTARLDMASRS